MSPLASRRDLRSPKSESSTRARKPVSMTSSSRCPRATAPTPASAVSPCLEGRDSGSLSHAPWSTIRRFCYWMRRQVRWTARMNGWFSRRLRGQPRWILVVLRSRWLIGCLPFGGAIAFWFCMLEDLWRRGRMRSLWVEGGVLSDGACAEA
jgi:hypothetical protein